VPPTPPPPISHEHYQAYCLFYKETYNIFLCPQIQFTDNITCSCNFQSERNVSTRGGRKGRRCTVSWLYLIGGLGLATWRGGGCDCRKFKWKQNVFSGSGTCWSHPAISGTCLFQRANMSWGISKQNRAPALSCLLNFYEILYLETRSRFLLQFVPKSLCVEGLVAHLWCCWSLAVGPSGSEVIGGVALKKTLGPQTLLSLALSLFVCFLVS
jgi:hypothetical protein